MTENTKDLDAGADIDFQVRIEAFHAAVRSAEVKRALSRAELSAVTSLISTLTELLAESFSSNPEPEVASPISVPPISVLVYLPSQSDTPVNRERVAAALTQLVKAFDVGTLEVDAASQQSWVATFVVRVRALVRQPEVASRLEKMERALQLQAIGRHQAAIDKDEAEGVAALIQALAAVPDATVAIGSLLIVKHTTELGARLVVRNVSEEEQRWVAAAMNVRIDTGIPAGDPLPPQDALKHHIAAERLHELAVGSIEPESAIDRSATCPCV